MVYIPAAVKTFDQIVNDVIEFIQNRAPFADLGANEVYRDIMVEPMGNELSKSWDYNQFLAYGQSLVNIILLDDDADFKNQLSASLGYSAEQLQEAIDGVLDNWGNDLGIPRLDATAAGCGVVFYSESRPTGNIVIPEGTLVSTNAEDNIPAVQFRTTRAASLSPATADADFNMETGLYETEVPAVAVVAGRDGNVASYTIKTMQSTVAVKLENREAATGGADQESNSAYADRLRRAFTGNFRGTRDGLNNIVRSYGADVRDAYVAGTGDILQARGAGSVDIYVVGQVLTSHMDAAVFAGQSDEYVLAQQPVTSVSTVVGATSGAIPAAYYVLRTDTGVFSGSVDGRDAVVWRPAAAVKSIDAVLGYGKLTAPSALPGYSEGAAISSRIKVYRDGMEEGASEGWVYDDASGEDVIRIGIAEFDQNATYTILALPDQGDELTITYWHNNLIFSLQELIGADSNHILGQDVLVKAGAEVGIDVSLTVEIDGTTTTAQARSDVTNILSAQLASYSLGALITQAGLVDAIYGDVQGVVNVRIPFTKLARAGGTGVSDIQLANNEYSLPGTLVVNVVEA